MKTKLSLLTLALCGMFAFTSCDNDDDNYLPDQTVTKAFDDKYPNAGKVEWETKGGYEVADFKVSGCDTEAWFDNKGNWVMTKTEINFGLLPEPVRKSLNSGEYKDWKPTDFDKLERSNAATVYVIEVEQGEQEFDLYYTEDGILLKAAPDDDNDNFQPIMIPQDLTEIINEMYPGATILEYEKEKNGFDVDILHNNIYKDVYFNTDYEWLSTEWDIMVTEVPAIVMNAYKASDYKDYRIDDAELIEKPTGIFYVLELEKGNNDVKITISAEGNIEDVHKD